VSGAPKSTRMHRLRVVPVVVLALALGLIAAGCGTDARPARNTAVSEPSVSAADQACRDRWHQLSNDLGSKAARGVMVRRVFESRWESIEAGIGYYESTARADQCGDLLTAQRRSISDLDAVVTKALPYDLEQRAVAATQSRAVWRAAHPGKKEPKAVRGAYRTLQGEVATASRDLSPALTELAGVDPGQPRAVTRAVKDVALLASTSNAYVACRRALAKVFVFQHPPKKAKKKKAGKKG
jgi:hypothetical protein